MIGGINLFSPTSYANGHPTDQYAWLRDNDPVHWHSEPDGPGFWAVTRYEDVKALSRNTALFSSRPTIMIDDGSAMDLGDHTMMLTMDPPRHTQYRKLVAPRFLRRAVGRMRPEIERLAAEIIDGVARPGRVRPGRGHRRRCSPRTSSPRCSASRARTESACTG